jgi:hypothetical protein
MQKRNFITGLVLTFSLVIAGQAFADETDGLAALLKKVDQLACSQPEQLPQYYSSDLVIMVDDKRSLLDHRIQDYRQMLSDFRELKCEVQRQVLRGKVGKDVSYLIADEFISVTSKSNDTTERQHSICSYIFTQEESQWKIALEHCSSLPDYSIDPEDDALYYFHNPIY